MMRGNSTPITLEAVEPVADLLRALANPHRLAIVCTLVSGERAVSELETELGIRQPSLSQQLAALREAEIIVSRRVAKAVFYKIADPRAAQLVEAMHAIFCAGPKPATKRSASSPPVVRRGVAPAAPSLPRRTEAAMFARMGEDA